MKEWLKKIAAKARSEKLVVRAALGVLAFIIISILLLVGVSYLRDRRLDPVFAVEFFPAGNSGLVVKFKTKRPLKSVVEYGTLAMHSFFKYAQARGSTQKSAPYLNSAVASGDYEVDHFVDIMGLLPEKEHVFRIVCEDEAGAFFYSRFYRVK